MKNWRKNMINLSKKGEINDHGSQQNMAKNYHDYQVYQYQNGKNTMIFFTARNAVIEAAGRERWHEVPSPNSWRVWGRCKPPQGVQPLENLQFLPFWKLGNGIFSKIRAWLWSFVSEQLSQNLGLKNFLSSELLSHELLVSERGHSLETTIRHWEEKNFLWYWLPL